MSPTGPAFLAVAPPWPAIGIAVAATVAVAIAWFMVRLGRVSVWAAMGSIVGLLGILSLLVTDVRASTEVGTAAAVGIGAAAGLVLYAATASFMFVAVGWPPLRRQARQIYELRGGRSLPVALAVACLVIAPGEEIVWRGVVGQLLGGWLGDVGGAAGAWLLYMGANAASASIPILLGAVVGGVAWSVLAVLTGGVAASIACHAVWTGLMILLPPVFEGRT